MIAAFGIIILSVIAAGINLWLHDIQTGLLWLVLASVWAVFLEVNSLKNNKENDND